MKVIFALLKLKAQSYQDERVDENINGASALRPLESPRDTAQGPAQTATAPTAILKLKPTNCIA